MYILGISAFYHDSAAALIRDGELVAAAQEERFSRRKHDAAFPRGAIGFCLRHERISLRDVSFVVFYDKPLLKFERLLETYVNHAPRGFASFTASMPLWLKEKMNLKSLLRGELASMSGIRAKELPPLLFDEHHHSHAASAFFPSPFDQAAVLCVDGVGEWATTSVWLGWGNRLDPQWQIDFPHSLGLLYSAFTYYTGFRVNSGEYKVMGLAPYGTPRFADTIRKHLIDIKPDGTFRLDPRYFGYETGLRMTNDRFHRLFEGQPRSPEGPLTQRDMDLAASIQLVTEEVMLALARTIRRELGASHLCLAGGVALNCVANGRVLREAGFDDIWIQPAAGDAGGAIGAALAVWHEYLGKPRAPNGHDGMQGSYLGPAFDAAVIADELTRLGADFRPLDDDRLLPHTAELLDKGSVVGWFDGRMEFGPRALGARSILGDPRKPDMQSAMNLRIKFRESFRPFAPSVLADLAARYFELDRPSPYMMLVAPVREELRIPMTGADGKRFGIDKLKVPRSTIPAVTHLDHSSRIQTVHRQTNPRYHALIESFHALTGCGVVVNTSFNVRGEPIVCTPGQAYACFMATGMEYLVLGNFILEKGRQPEWHGRHGAFDLD
jgi:carbamoyltransferase